MNFYFREFASDLVEFEIIRNLEIVGATKGIPNKEQGSSVWHIYPDAPIQNGDILRDVKRDKSYQITSCEPDEFAGSEFYQVYFTIVSP